jgi:hypothetical protein
MLRNLGWQSKKRAILSFRGKLQISRTSLDYNVRGDVNSPSNTSLNFHGLLFS